MKVTVLGSGGWGTALAIAFSKRGHDVNLWSKFSEEIDALSQTRENPLLKGVKIPDSVVLTDDVKCVEGADAVIFAVPSFATRDTATLFKPYIAPEIPLVNVSKGMEKGSLMLLSEVIGEVFPDNHVAVLSGPSHAEEVARGVATTLVVCCEHRRTAEFIQHNFCSDTIRIYTNDDVKGVEIGGALKNVIAVCKGICDGLGMGDNTVAALMTRGLTEMARLGVAMGARESTFAGLTGLGDLIVTCMSEHSRNHRFGILIGKGVDVDTALKDIGMTVEGYHATANAKALSLKYKVEMPIVEQIYSVLYDNKDVKKAISDLINRPLKEETEEVWLQ